VSDVATSAVTKFGIMQGRLVPPDGGRFQSFPRERWRDEFPRAQAASIDYIEWIIDGYGEDVNPVLSDAGLRELDALKKKHGVETLGICADWFMDYPLLRCTAAQRTEREAFLNRLPSIAKRIGAGYIVLPFVDISRIETEAEKDALVKILLAATPFAEASGVELHLETDLEPANFAALLARVQHPLVKANFDSGNSSGLGYVASAEFGAYGERIGSIHIKDRLSNAAGGIKTMPLGHGSADFEDVFGCMSRIRYDRPVTLQVARDKDDDEVNWIREQLAFVKRYWT
jgi:hexulose-6-phosphate isomerase